ncbi:MAG: hypothetical protein ACPGJV_06745 [Bacteriovoracaceae bacterium]
MKTLILSLLLSGIAKAAPPTINTASGNISCQKGDIRFEINCGLDGIPTNDMSFEKAHKEFNGKVCNLRMFSSGEFEKLVFNLNNTIDRIRHAHFNVEASDDVKIEIRKLQRLSNGLNGGRFLHTVKGYSILFKSKTERFATIGFESELNKGTILSLNLLDGFNPLIEKGTAEVGNGGPRTLRGLSIKESNLVGLESLSKKISRIVENEDCN